MNEDIKKDNNYNCSDYINEMKDEFLSKDDDNYDVLINKMKSMINILQSQKIKRQARRHMDPNFVYENELTKCDLSEYSRSYEESIALSMQAFEGCIRWHNPSSLFNITPPPLLDTVSLTALTNLYNPNGVWDLTSGKFTLMEKKVIKYLSGLVNWDYKKSGGVFTYGGKGTLTYAVKSGLNRCDRLSVSEGLKGNYIVIANECSHFSLDTVINQLGIGKSNLLRIKNDNDGFMDLKILENTIRESISKGNKIACIVLSGGGTIDLRVDPIRPVSLIIDKIVKEYQLDYRPYLHVDSVISWAWMFFKSDYKKFNIKMKKEVKDDIYEVYNKIKDIEYADSFGVDFHKTGLCPYNSSCYVCKDDKELTSFSKNEIVDVKSYLYGEELTFDKSIENTRSCSGIISAYHMLERLGIEGIQKYIIHRISVKELFKEIINERYKNYFEIINNRSHGFEIVIKINFKNEIKSIDDIYNSTESEQEIYKNLCEEFCEYMTYGDYCNKNDIPLIGYISNYTSHGYDYSLPAFLLYPMAIQYNEEIIIEILEKLRSVINCFEKDKNNKNFIPQRCTKGIREYPK